jgi:hypothetical protein
LGDLPSQTAMLRVVFITGALQSQKVCLKHFYIWRNLIFAGRGENNDWKGHQSEDKTIFLVYESQIHGK